MKFLCRKGFSLMEVIVALGVFSVLAGLFAVSMVDMKTSQNEFVDRNEAILFVNTLSTSLLGSQDQCSAIAKNFALPAPGAPAVPFVINNYHGYGNNSAAGATLQTGSVLTGTTQNPGLRLKALTISAKDIPDISVTSNSVNYKRRIAVLTVSLESRNLKKRDNSFVAYPDRVLEFPVFVESASGKIASCQLAMQPSDVCQMIGATSSGGVCKPQVQCQLKGTYTLSTCSPAYSGCPPSMINPVTGIAGCPSDASATQTGTTSGTFTVSCGKKCAYNVTNSVGFYICMKCQ